MSAPSILNESSLQIEQLILDVAVAKQFQQTKRELEAMALDTKSLQEELQAVQFSQDSKAGRMLMAKCRALQVMNLVLAQKIVSIMLFFLYFSMTLCSELLRYHYLFVSPM